MAEIDIHVRVAKLEAEFQHMREQMKETSDDLKVVTAKISTMVDMFNQAKGARWAILAVIGVAGFLGSKVASILPMFGK